MRTISDERPISDLPPHASGRRDRDADDVLLADLNAPPSVEDALEAHRYWRDRRDRLPLLRRSARREAELMTARWKERLVAAERERYGPGLVEQLRGLIEHLLLLLGVRRLPDTRRFVRRAQQLAAATVALTALFVIAVIALVHVL